MLLMIIDCCTSSFDYGMVADMHGCSTWSNNYLNSIHAIRQALLLVNRFLHFRNLETQEKPHFSNVELAAPCKSSLLSFCG